VVKNEAERILKCKDLNNRSTAHMDCESKSDTGSNRGDWNHFKSLRQYQSNIPGKQENKEMQKKVIVGTVHVLGKVLM
jgi:hypothetical protein